MTTMYDVLDKCAICGTENQHKVVGSYSTFGSMTDGRPMFMGINPIGSEVHRCSGCGYCAIRLRENIGISPEDLRSDEYIEALRSRSYHECCAMLLSKAGFHDDAYRMYHHAAWLADDEAGRCFFELRSHPDKETILRKAMDDAEGQALNMRWKAIRELLQTSLIGKGMRLVMADLFRCVGEFELARDQVFKSMDDPRDVGYRGTARQILRLIDEGSQSPSVICEHIDGDDPVVCEIKIDNTPFRNIVEGRKTMELFVNDRKHRGILVGYIIAFRDWLTSAVTYVDVTDVKVFPSFAELYNSVEKKCFDPDGTAPDPSDMEKRFSKQDQERCGVMAVSFTPHPIHEGW